MENCETPAAGAAATDATMRNIDIQQIMRMIPHRFPFLLVDRVLELEPGKRGVAIKNVTFNEPQFLGHFPNQPVMPGVMIVEAIAQLGGIVTAALDKPGHPPRIGFLAAINDVKFRRMVIPGDQLRLEIEVISAKRMIGKVRGRALVGEELAAEAEILFVMQTPPPEA